MEECISSSFSIKQTRNGNSKINYEASRVVGIINLCEENLENLHIHRVLLSLN